MQYRSYTMPYKALHVIAIPCSMLTIEKLQVTETVALLKTG